MTFLRVLGVRGFTEFGLQARAFGPDLMKDLVLAWGLGF